jgi:hypothetical protein
MKLYHATNEEYLGSIKEFGLKVNCTDKPSKEDFDAGIVTEKKVVYGFNNIRDAISFGYDNNDHIIICVFDAPETELEMDKEYEDGNAFTVEHDIPSSDISFLNEDEMIEKGII